MKLQISVEEFATPNNNLLSKLNLIYHTHLQVETLRDNQFHLTELTLVVSLNLTLTVSLEQWRHKFPTNGSRKDKIEHSSLKEVPMPVWVNLDHNG
jgi:hypothetical protein